MPPETLGHLFGLAKRWRLMDAQSANRETDTKTDTNRARAGKPEFTRVMRIRFAGRTMGSEYTQVVNDTSRSSLTEPYLWSHLPRLSPNVRNPFPPERVPSCPKPALSHIGNAGTSHPRRQRPASVPFPKLRASASPFRRRPGRPSPPSRPSLGYGAATGVRRHGVPASAGEHQPNPATLVHRRTAEGGCRFRWVPR